MARRRRFRSRGLRFRGGGGPARRGRAPLLLSAAIGIGLALLLIGAVDAALRPTLTALAEAKVSNRITGIVNDAVAQTLEEEGISYADLVTLEKDSAGRVTVLTTDSAKCNQLRTEILDTVLCEVEELDSEDLGIPLGTLTGISAASGWGPLLPVGVLTASTPAAEFRNEFASAGINQTLHRIMLDVTVKATLLIPGGRTETTVTAQVCVAETLLVGEVPDTFLDWQGAAS